MALDIESWERTFQELIQQKKPRARWTLKLDEKLQPDCVAPEWKQYQQRAFGSFRCSSCQRRWASARVQVLCHMYRVQPMSQGKVLMRLFGQRCKKCYRSQYEKPEFSSKSAMRILHNLVQHILERCYSKGIRTVPEIPVTVEVPLRGSHDTANCEACALHICTWRSRSLRTKPTTSPLPHPESGSSLPPVGNAFVQNRPRNESADARSAQGSGLNCVLMVSQPSHATARAQESEAGPQATQGSSPQATRGTDSQPILVAGSLSTGSADTQPAQVVGPLHTNPQATRGLQAAGRAAPQATQGSAPQATRGSAAQTTWGTDSQITCGTSPTTTHGSRTSSGTQAVWPVTTSSAFCEPRNRVVSESLITESRSPLTWERQVRSSPRRPSSDSTFRSSLLPPNGGSGHNQRLLWGCMCVVALFAFIATGYLNGEG